MERYQPLRLVSEETVDEEFQPTIVVAWDGLSFDLLTTIPGWDTSQEEELEIILDTEAGEVFLDYKPGNPANFRIRLAPVTLNPELEPEIRQLVGDTIYDFCQRSAQTIPFLEQKADDTTKQVLGFPELEAAELRNLQRLWIDMYRAAKQLPDAN